jgi:hypothetical protein
MPGLMRGMARTAAVVGTATATRNAVNNKNAAKTSAASAAAAPVVQSAPPPPQVVYTQAPPAPEEDVITQLERLGALKAQGILTEEEFQAQKAKLLGI